MFPEALKIGEYLQALLEESIRGFQGAELHPTQSGGSKSSLTTAFRGTVAALEWKP